MAVGIMHRLAMKFRAMIRWVLAACGHRPMVALAIVEMMINVSIEMSRSVIPRSCADKYAPNKPFRPVITIWSAIVRRDFIVAVGTHGRRSDAGRNLCLGAITLRHENTTSKNQNAYAFQCLHRPDLPSCETTDLDECF